MEWFGYLISSFDTLKGCWWKQFWRRNKSKFDFNEIGVKHDKRGG